jgi:hypothetical protein
MNKKLRWTIDILAVVALLVSGFLSWMDVPSASTASRLLGDINAYYGESVWIGVAQPDSFQDVSFADPPTLELRATRTGWRGSFYFTINEFPDVRAESGTFVLLLPIKSSIGRIDVTGAAAAVDKDASNSRLIVNIRVALDEGRRRVRLSLPVEWRDSALTQRLGFGRTRRTVLSSSAYRNPEGRPFALARFHGRRDPSQPITPGDAVLILHTRQRADSLTDPQPAPDSSVIGPETLSYRLAEADAPTVCCRGIFRSFSFVEENPRIRFLLQMNAQLFFVALGFILAEVATIVSSKSRKSVRP